MVDITIVNGVYKPTYNWGAPPCILFLYMSWKFHWAQKWAPREFTTEAAEAIVVAVVSLHWLVFYGFPYWMIIIPNILGSKIHYDHQPTRVLNDLPPSAMLSVFVAVCGSPSRVRRVSQPVSRNKLEIESRRLPEEFCKSQLFIKFQVFQDHPKSVYRDYVVSAMNYWVTPQKHWRWEPRTGRTHGTGGCCKVYPWFSLSIHTLMYMNILVFFYI